MRSILKTTAMAAGILGASLIGAAHADTIFNSDFQSRGSASITYPSSKNVGLGEFAIRNVNPANDPYGAPVNPLLFNAYCATLNVTNANDPANIAVTNAYYLHSMTKTNNIYLANSGFQDVGNRLEYLLQTAGTSGDDKAALQLALWKTIDNNFAFTSPSSGSIYSKYLALMSFSSYTSGTVYNANAVYLVVSGATWAPNHSGNYQNLVAILNNPNVIPGGPGTVPEPASVISALIGLGAAGIFGARRARSQKAA